jgi:hypothetical protein
MTTRAALEAIQPRHPWERQPGETPKAWRAFTIYRDLGDQRTLQRTADALRQHVATIRDWSRRNGWVLRSQAWDTEQDRIRQAAAFAEIQTMAKKHANQAGLAQETLMIPIRVVAEKLAAGGADGLREWVEGLSHSDALELSLQSAKALPVLQQAERLARGEPTEITQSQNLNLNLSVQKTIPDEEKLRAIVDGLRAARVIPAEELPDDPGEIIVVSAGNDEAPDLEPA